MDAFEDCPCGAGAMFGQCCGPLLAGIAEAPTAEALMRSRFTAFRLRHGEYLKATWDPAHCPSSLDFEGDDRSWSRLEIVETRAGGVDDENGVVEFKAEFEWRGETHVLHERSRFRKLSGRWLYVDGDIRHHGKLAERGGIGRNAPCPCGSGKKYKKCCGQ